jgi:SNF2 family DNA or RNA helicase
MSNGTSIVQGNHTDNLQRLFKQELPPETMAVYYQGKCLSRAEASNLPFWEKKILVLNSQSKEIHKLSSETYNLFFTHFNLLKSSYENPLASSGYSRTMLLPHQVEAAIRVLTSLKPRFLIADEVGLGKTIEAGLIIKELILKNNYEKILICVPASLQAQWQTELKEKFDEDFKIIKGPDLRKKSDPLAQSNRVIISHDLAKIPEVRDRLVQKGFQIAVFDEAHRLRRDQNKVTQGYQLAEAISKATEAFLLLSATPFRGKLEEIYYSISLLDPDILGPVHTFLNDPAASDAKSLQRKLSPVVIRRRKVDIGGFTKRFAKTVKLTLQPIELEYYQQVTKYVKEQFNRAVSEGNSIRSFVMITFQKLLDSSVYALNNSLLNRVKKLEDSLHPGNLLEKRLLSVTENWEDSDSPIEEAMIAEEKLLVNEINEELFQIRKLLNFSKKIDQDSKLLTLINLLKEMREAGHEKFLIFSQFKSTVFYLQQSLSSLFSVNIFHGGMSFSEKEEAISWFKENGEILILTEAGGEGRNLQESSILINYDLPWSPLKVEQRIGRIHRFGQKRDCHIINFTCAGTVAERVLEVLEEKIQIFEDAFGESDTMIGLLEDESSFRDCFKAFLNQKKTKAEIDSEINRQLKRARLMAKKLNLLLSPEHMSYNMQSFENSTSGKLDAIGEKFFHALCKVFPDEISVETKQNASFQYKWKEVSGVLTFSRSTIGKDFEYISPAHKLVQESAVRLANLFPVGGVSVLTNSEVQGCEVFLEVSFNFNRAIKRLYSIFISKQKYMKLKVEKEEDLLDMKNTLVMLAMDKVGKQITKDLDSLEKKLRSSYGYWKESIEHSASKRDSELKYKIDLQKSQMRWYGSSQGKVSALSRAQNSRTKLAVSKESKLWQLQDQLRGDVTVSLRGLVLHGSH